MRYLAAGVPVGLGVDGSASNDGNHLLGEARQAMLLARLDLGLRRDGDGLRQDGDSLRQDGDGPRPDRPWMGAREALRIATRGGAELLGRSDIGALAVGALRRLLHARSRRHRLCGGTRRPVAAALFCAPQPARHTVIHGRHVVVDGRIATLDIAPVIAAHNRHAARLLG